MAEFLVPVVVAMIMLDVVVGRQIRLDSSHEDQERIQLLFWAECKNYYDWQTVGVMHSFNKVQQPGSITRLLSCRDEDKINYRGMELAPTHEVPSINTHLMAGHDWYPAWNKAAGIVHWLNYSRDANIVDWVVILDSTVIIRDPILPWQLGAEKGRPLAAHNRGLISGLMVVHIEDLRVLAPMWLSKTESVIKDAKKWESKIPGDIYSTGVEEVGFELKISDKLLIHPGLVPREGVEPLALDYAIPFSVGYWSFNKLDHLEDDIVYTCGRLFSEPPNTKELVESMESEPRKRHALLLSIECVNTLNEGIMLKHAENKACPKPSWSKYLSFSYSRTSAKSTRPKIQTSFHSFQSKELVKRELREEPKNLKIPAAIETSTNGTSSTSYFPLLIFVAFIIFLIVMAVYYYETAAAKPLKVKDNELPEDDYSLIRIDSDGYFTINDIEAAI